MNADDMRNTTPEERAASMMDAQQSARVVALGAGLSMLPYDAPAPGFHVASQMDGDGHVRLTLRCTRCDPCVSTMLVLNDPSANGVKAITDELTARLAAGGCPHAVPGIGE